MAYFKIGDVDFSPYVSSLNITKNVVYNSQTNAAGNSIVDYINTKRTIEVSIIPLDEVSMLKLQLAIGAFNVSISFLNPTTNELEKNVNCIIPEDKVEYYTIQSNKVMFKAFNLTFTEL